MEKVLLVDDDPDALEVLDWTLSDWGFSVRTAASGEYALTLAESFEPAVLITDYCLEGELTGVDVIRRLRGEIQGLRAVLVTGLPLERFRHELEGLDEVMVVSKPFRWSELCTQLDLDFPPSSRLVTARKNLPADNPGNRAGLAAEEPLI